jgi:hypothetical protein
MGEPLAIAPRAQHTGDCHVHAHASFMPTYSGFLSPFEGQRRGDVCQMSQSLRKIA